MAGAGPTFIEALTYRYEGHNVGDVQNYRDKSEVAAWLESRDPIDRLRRFLTERGHLDDAAFGEATSRARDIVADAIAFAETSPWPDTGSVDQAWPAAPAVAGAR
jgi:pyruvate dehydrogenase E1 component alpha subunit